MTCLKALLFVINFAILLSGAVTTFWGLWIFFEPSKGYLLNLFMTDLMPQKTVDVIAYSISTLGFIVMFVALFFGCRSAVRETQCILGTYIGSLVILTVLELIGATFLGLMTFRILAGLETRFANKLQRGYGHDLTSDQSFSQSLDFAQNAFNCCGIHDDKDYNGTAWYRDSEITGKRRQVPLTCCVLKDAESRNTGSPMSVISRVFHSDNDKPWLHPQPKDENACQANDDAANEKFRHKEGCLAIITNWLQFETYTIIILSLLLSSLQISGIAVSIFLCRRVIGNG